MVSLPLYSFRIPLKLVIPNVFDQLFPEDLQLLPFVAVSSHLLQKMSRIIGTMISPFVHGPRCLDNVPALSFYRVQGSETCLALTSGRTRPPSIKFLHLFGCNPEIAFLSTSLFVLSCESHENAELGIVEEFPNPRKEKSAWKFFCTLKMSTTEDSQGWKEMTLQCYLNLTKNLYKMYTYITISCMECIRAVHVQLIQRLQDYTKMATQRKSSVILSKVNQFNFFHYGAWISDICFR